MLGKDFLRSMSTFEYVLFYADVNKAAEALNVSTLIIFQILEELEKSLDAVLIEWDGVVPILTKAGINVQKAMEARKNAMANAFVDSCETAKNGQVSISCTEAFAAFLSIPT